LVTLDTAGIAYLCKKSEDSSYVRLIVVDCGRIARRVLRDISGRCRVERCTSACTILIVLILIVIGLTLAGGGVASGEMSRAPEETRHKETLQQQQPLDSLKMTKCHLADANK